MTLFCLLKSSLVCFHISVVLTYPLLFVNDLTPTGRIRKSLLSNLYYHILVILIQCHFNEENLC